MDSSNSDTWNLDSTTDPRLAQTSDNGANMGRYSRAPPNEGTMPTIYEAQTETKGNPEALPPKSTRQSPRTIDDASGEATGGPQQPLVTPPFPSQSNNIQLVEIRNQDGSGWPAMSKAVREYDEEEIQYCKEDIDTLLVFTGLYSAILSAFTIESYRFLLPDADDKIVFLFQKMISQNYTMSNGFFNATDPYPTLPDFEAPLWAIRVNVLWFSSLVVSIAVASYGMLVKQWLREYLDLSKHTSPHERLRARQYRRPALDRWRVFTIAASLPLLLEISLGLFFAGLCYFTTAIHSSISRSTIPLVAAWAFFFLVTTIAPLVSPRCPFKTTLLRSLMRQLRRITFHIARTCIPFYAFAIRHALEAYFRGSSAIRTGVASLRVSLHRIFTFILAPPLICRAHHSTSSTAPRASNLTSSLSSEGDREDKWHDLIARHSNTSDLLNRLESHMEEETKALAKQQDDMDILRSVVEITPGDGLLLTIADIASIIKPTWSESFALMQTIVANRTGCIISPDNHESWAPSVHSLSQQAWEALATWVSNIVRDSRFESAILPYSNHSDISQCYDLFYSFISCSDHPLSGQLEKTFRDLILLRKIQPPRHLFLSDGFLRRLEQLFSPSAETAKLPSNEHYDTWASAVESVIQRTEIVIEEGSVYLISRWVKNALVLLVSQWKAVSPTIHPRKDRPSQPFSKKLIETFLNRFCDVGSRGIMPRNSGAFADQVDIFYGILLGATRSTENEWRDSLYTHVFTRNITSVLSLGPSLVYERESPDQDSSLKSAFLSSMQFHTSTWVQALLCWLAPYSMPGSLLSEMVAADLAASTPGDRLRKLNGIIHVCRIAGMDPENEPSDLSGRDLDFSGILQIIILLEREYVVRGNDRSEKIQMVRSAFRTAIIRRHTAYRLVMSAMFRRREYSRLRDLVGRMREERLDLVYAMGHGCYRESSWAGVINRKLYEKRLAYVQLKGDIGFVRLRNLRLVPTDAWVQKQLRDPKTNSGNRQEPQ